MENTHAWIQAETYDRNGRRRILRHGRSTKLCIGRWHVGREERKGTLTTSFGRGHDEFRHRRVGRSGFDPCVRAYTAQDCRDD